MLLAALRHSLLASAASSEPSVFGESLWIIWRDSSPPKTLSPPVCVDDVQPSIELTAAQLPFL